MKKYIITILIVIVLISNIAFSEDVTSTDVTVLIDGTKLESIDSEQGVNLPPIIFNNRTMIPLGKTMEAFGINASQISWDAEERSVTVVTNNYDMIWMQINNKEILFNGKMLKTDVPAIIYNNRTYIPTAMISSLLGTIPTWNAETRTVTMTPSTYNLSRFNVSFDYSRSEGYVLRDNFLDNKTYYYELNDLEHDTTESVLIFTQLSGNINNELDSYLKTRLLGTDDMTLLSEVPLAYSREQGDSRTTFVQNGDKTIQILSNGITYEDLVKLVNSIKEVR